MPEKMKCPFLEKDGEFADCYGAACMAYYEYKPVPVVIGSGTSVQKIPQPPVVLCRKMLSYAPYSCACG